MNRIGHSRFWIYGAHVPIIGALDFFLGGAWRVTNLENIDKVCFQDGSVPCSRYWLLTTLSLFTSDFLEVELLVIRAGTEHGISGLEKLLKLREIEFFGNIRLFVVTKVTSSVQRHIQIIQE